MENTYKTTDKASFCYNINFQTNNEKQIKDFCKMLVALFNASMGQCGNAKNVLKEKIYLEFMNYFINYKLHEAAYTKTGKENFYKEVTSKYSEFKNDEELKNRMFVINEKCLISLHILYKLYENYDKLNKNEVNLYNNFLKEMKSKYNYGLEICFYDGDIKFCEALQNFRNYYENNKISKSRFCIGKDEQCPNLPEINLTSKSNNKKLRIAIIGNELFRRSYNPTLNEYSLDNPEEYYNLKDLIFVHYNLRMEKDEEGKKCAMMKILYQFFQYCNNHKYNRKLASFIEEFIVEYYNKNKTQYETIFNECKSDNDRKEYCMLYKKCDNSFKEDLKIFKENASNYITEQEKYLITYLH
ncbi:hypothetical protein PVNG_06374 [Plasmodium vivax North Korean]|uniref:Variable surface protein n=1 Tax=Plasmodium vivax North Korean TaxID=1035514 RepID=A0A0J9TMU4_PLAVI|nr:hypothetical protein PVNG_06374 [Plasmodium vivax North Korean]